VLRKRKASTSDYIGAYGRSMAYLRLYSTVKIMVEETEEYVSSRNDNAMKRSLLYKWFAIMRRRDGSPS